jgi:hypothetical protein
MNALKSLFTRKKPLSSAPPANAGNQFSFVNPAIANQGVRNKLNRYVNTYKKMKSNNMEKIQKELQNYARQNPKAARELIRNRFNRRSHSNLSNLSNDQIANLRNEIFEPGISTKRIVNRMGALGGGCFCRRNRTTGRRNNRRSTRRNRRSACGCS